MSSTVVVLPMVDRRPFCRKVQHTAADLRVTIPDSPACGHDMLAMPPSRKIHSRVHWLRYRACYVLLLPLIGLHECNPKTVCFQYMFYYSMIMGGYLMVSIFSSVRTDFLGNLCPSLTYCSQSQYCSCLQADFEPNTEPGSMFLQAPSDWVFSVKENRQIFLPNCH